MFQAWRTALFGIYGFRNFTRQSFVEHSKKYKEEDMLIPMEGKNCVVTGANSGIGYATAAGLASRGANVHLVCRNRERGEAALAKIKSSTGNPNVFLEICDVSSMSDIKSFVSRVSSRGEPVHVLVNNAGILNNERVVTPEGLEASFAVNGVGTFALTELMLPLLKKAAPDARVITISSGGMYSAPLYNDFQFDERNFDGSRQYAQDKRLQVALTEWWSEVHGKDGVGFYSMHPGWADTPGVATSLPGFRQRLGDNLRTSEEGADTVVWLCLQPKDKLTSGGFYFDRAEAPKHLHLAATAGSHAHISTLTRRLLSLSTISS
ncbi:NAD(P)-binding Rossmann-fold superfamily protein [Wolffia australiana]